MKNNDTNGNVLTVTLNEPEWEYGVLYGEFYLSTLFPVRLKYPNGIQRPVKRSIVPRYKFGRGSGPIFRVRLTLIYTWNNHK